MRQIFGAMAVLCLLLSGACGQFDDKNRASDPGQFVRSTELDDTISVQVQPTSKAEKYMIYFSWPKMEDGKRFRIRQEQVLALVPSTQTTFSHEVDHNQTITYRFEVLNSSSLVEKTFSKLVKIPRDFVVKAGQSEFIEDQKLNVQRVFLSPDVPLKTNGHHIEISTNEIISDKGLIETFPESTKAQNSVNGRGAGEILLHAQSASGQLKIVMRGEDGGDGLKGEPYSSRAADGAVPGIGEYFCDDPPCKVCMVPPTALLNRCGCLSRGKDGGNGSRGDKGHTGGRAGNGGDTGTLKVEIQDGSAFLLQTESKPGSPGTPGEGGEGQPGGIAQGSKTVCSGNVGSNGATGPKGDSGPVGSVGAKGMICIYIASEAKNDCY